MGSAAPQREESLPQALADELLANLEELVARWLERITQRLEIEDQDIFPTDDLLDHVPVTPDAASDNA
ncbi:MAG: hypothetical protein ACR2F9_09740 [Longimicrobiaceae bacterium]